MGSNGEILCENGAQNVCSNGEYYCFDYVDGERLCTNNGVSFVCPDENSQCDIQYQIFYPTPFPTPAPTPVVVMSSTEEVKDDSDADSAYNLVTLYTFLCLFCFV